MPQQPAVCPVQVGRDEDVRALAGSLAAVGRPGGPGRLVLIGGEAGVGKSRLAAEAVREAESAGLTRLEGACAPEATVPYACFVHALRRRTRTMAPSEVLELFDGTACLAAVLLPEVAEMTAAAHRDAGAGGPVRGRLAAALAPGTADRQAPCCCWRTCTGPTPTACACSRTWRASWATSRCGW